MTTPPPVANDGVGEFRLDIDAAEVAVRKLEGVQREIEAARNEAVNVARTTPTARDAVSLEAFTLLAQKANGGPGSFTAAMEGAYAHVESIILQMRVDIARQREIDDAASGLSGRA